MSRAMKDSGIPWIGEIPKDWVVRKLRNVGRFSASGIDKKIVEGEPLVHIINYVDVYKNPNKELRAQEYMIVSAPIEKCSEHQVNVGDMIFTPSSETIEDIGVSAVIMDELPNTAFSYHVLRFQPNNVVDLKYRKYFTNNNYCLNYFSSCATGTIRKTIGRDVFKECLVVLPPLAEQQRIAEFLDRKCAEVDEMIALQEQIIEELKAYKQSVITEAVTKGLNPAAPMRDSGIEWIGSIPEHWEVTKFYRICSVITDFVASGSFESLRINVPYLDYPDYAMLVRTVDLSGKGRTAEKVYISKHSYDFLSNSNLFGGEIILPNIGASVGDVYIVPNLYERMSLAPNSIMFKTKQCDRYWYYYFYSEAGKQSIFDICQSTAQPKFNKTELRDIRVCIPTKNEQQTIADYLDEKCADIDSLIQTKQSKIDSLKEYKKSIIYEYVTGKREVVL